MPVVNPSTASAYELQESDSSKAGDEYEIANGEPIPCLGEKHIVVFISVGTLRGYGSQCANVSEALRSVRAVRKSGHAACFNMGPDGNQHMIINRYTGEVNYMDDDAINYIQRLFVVPSDKVEAVQGAIKQLKQLNEQSFGGQGS